MREQKEWRVDEMKLVVLYRLPTIFPLPLLSRVAVYSRVMH